jgi:hypothetical protein
MFTYLISIRHLVLALIVINHLLEFLIVPIRNYVLIPKKYLSLVSVEVDFLPLNLFLLCLIFVEGFLYMGEFTFSSFITKPSLEKHTQIRALFLGYLSKNLTHQHFFFCQFFFFLLFFEHLVSHFLIASTTLVRIVLDHFLYLLGFLFIFHSKRLICDFLL